ncbi:hypothetical protein LEMLEM_LOCUS7747 [Lemmus lemmus]
MIRPLVARAAGPEPERIMKTWQTRLASGINGFNLLVFRENFQELQKCEKDAHDNMMLSLSAEIRDCRKFCYQLNVSLTQLHVQFVWFVH